MPDTLIECVPNFSEGQRPEVVQSIVAAMRVDGVRLLDWSLDGDHNRSVVTVAGPPAGVIEAAIRGAGRAAELIDLTSQHGVHPRIGAADVIPFVPVRDISLEQCALLARQAGSEIWKRYQVPVYFYEAAAARPDRAMLEEVRRDANRVGPGRILPSTENDPDSSAGGTHGRETICSSRIPENRRRVGGRVHPGRRRPQDEAEP